jgi:peptidoglycan hydrolase-like protein with peptidoglycan-binding domain
MAKKKHIVVPLKRVVKYKTTGPDARAVKRALRRLGFTKGKKITPVFGAYSVRALKKAQRKFGIPADGVYGPRTHRAFLRHNAYDPFGALLMSSVKLKKTPATEDVRSRMVAICQYCYAHRERMNYLQRRPMMAIIWNTTFPNVPGLLDCSEFRTWVSRQVHVHDPNGMNYNGYGNTSTLKASGRWTRFPLPGDDCHYGHTAYGKHVTIYIGGGRQIGMGSDAGPTLGSVYYRPDFDGYVVHAF